MQVHAIFLKMQRLEQNSAVVCGWCKRDILYKNMAHHICFQPYRSHWIDLRGGKTHLHVYPVDEEGRMLMDNPRNYAIYSDEVDYAHRYMPVDQASIVSRSAPVALPGPNLPKAAMPRQCEKPSIAPPRPHRSEKLHRVKIEDPEMHTSYDVMLDDKSLSEILNDQAAYIKLRLQLRVSAKENEERKKIDNKVPSVDTMKVSDTLPKGILKERDENSHNEYKSEKVKTKYPENNSEENSNSEEEDFNNDEYVAKEYSSQKNKQTMKKAYGSSMSIPRKIKPRSLKNSTTKSTQDQVIPSTSKVNEEKETDDRFTWTKPMILLMLHEYDEQLKLCGRSSHAKTKCWRKVEHKMKQFGYQECDEERCRKKFQSLKTQFSKINDHNSTSGNNPKKFEYSKELQNILADDVSIEPKSIASSEKHSSESDSDSDKSVSQKIKKRKISKKKKKTATDFIADLVEERRKAREQKEIRTQRKIAAAEKLTDLLGEILKK